LIFVVAIIGRVFENLWPMKVPRCVMFRQTSRKFVVKYCWLSCYKSGFRTSHLDLWRPVVLQQCQTGASWRILWHHLPTVDLRFNIDVTMQLVLFIEKSRKLFHKKVFKKNFCLLNNILHLSRSHHFSEFAKFLKLCCITEQKS